MKCLEWVLLGIFLLLILGVIFWPVMPYVIGWLWLFNSWRFPWL